MIYCLLQKPEKGIAIGVYLREGNLHTVVHGYSKLLSERVRVPVLLVARDYGVQLLLVRHRLV